MMQLQEVCASEQGQSSRPSLAFILNQRNSVHHNSAATLIQMYATIWLDVGTKAVKSSLV